jgi:hypothetical protein
MMGYMSYMMGWGWSISWGMFGLFFMSESVDKLLTDLLGEGQFNL